MTDLAVAALVRKRAELAGEVRLAEERLDQLRANILHLDAAIRIIDPSYHTDAIVPKVRRQRREWFGNGELLRMVLETLRKAPEPLTAQEIAVALMERKGFDATDAATVRAGGRHRPAAGGSGRAGSVRAAQRGVEDRGLTADAHRRTPKPSTICLEMLP